MRLHHGVSPREQFHAHAFARFEHLPIRWTDLPAAGLASVEEIQNVCFVETRKLTQSSDRPAHLRAFHRAQESDRDANRVGHPGQRQSLRGSQLPKMSPYCAS